MKNLIKISILSILFFSGLTSCKKNDDSAPSTTINSTIQQGKWKITWYSDNGNDETSHYSDYAFQFNSDGTISAVKSGSSVNGTWSDGNDDDQVKLNLNFGTTVPFQELNNDWHVIQQNSSIIKAEDVSGGNGGTDNLTFEKI